MGSGATNPPETVAPLFRSAGAFERKVRAGAPAAPSRHRSVDSHAITMKGHPMRRSLRQELLEAMRDESGCKR